MMNTKKYMLQFNFNTRSILWISQRNFPFIAKESFQRLKDRLNVLNIAFSIVPFVIYLMYVYEFLSIGRLVGCRVKVNCLLVGLGPVGGMPSVGVFLRDHSPYLLGFRRKRWKTLNG